jgi:hypothetical protein
MTAELQTTVLSVIGLFLVIVGILQGFIIQGQKRMEKAISDLWARVNSHGHTVECPNPECRAMRTSHVVIMGSEL